MSSAAGQAVDGPPVRAGFHFFTELQTRWSDNDMYGHLNNVIYNRFFEAILGVFFQKHIPLDLVGSPVIPVAAEVLTRFRRPLSFPETIDGAVRVTKVGVTSVRYELALFRQGEDTASAHGHWVDVFFDRRTDEKAPIPGDARRSFETHMRMDAGRD